jgi:hypothetical protein
MQKQICEKLHLVCIDKTKKDISFHYPNGSIDCNPIECLGHAHADESRLIVIYGNIWIDLSCIDINKESKNKVHFDYIKTCLKIAKQYVTILSNKIKTYENKKG